MSPKRIQKQTTEKQNITDTTTTKQMLKHEYKINLELMKKIATEKTTLPYRLNQDRENVKVGTKKVRNYY